MNPFSYPVTSSSGSVPMATNSRHSQTHIPSCLNVIAVRFQVSTIPPPPAQQSHPETQDHPGGRNDTNSPLVAITTVVSKSTTSCGQPSLLPVPPGPTVTTWICLGWQVLRGLEAVMQHYQAAGFSKRSLDSRQPLELAAAPRRPSTNRAWLRFTHWATGQGTDLLGPTAAQIAAFLYYLFDTQGLSPHSIKGYRSCLASVLSCTGMAAAVQAKTMSDMITSMELQRSRMTLVLPQWDLDIILEALSTIVPLREASLKHLTLKTVFLLAMASAGRCSELQALVCDTQYIQFPALRGPGYTIVYPQVHAIKSET